MSDERTRRSGLLGEETFLDNSVYKNHEVRQYSYDIFTVWKEHRFLTVGDDQHHLNLFDKLIEYLNKLNAKPVVSDRVFKMTFEMTQD